MKYLVDTDVPIDALHGSQQAVGMLQTLATDGIALSLISIAELFEGAFHSPDPEQRLSEARQFVQAYPKIGISETICEEFARQRAALRQRGLRVPDMDLWIAATMITHDLTIVTRNTRHFSRIRGLKLYQGN